MTKKELIRAVADDVGMTQKDTSFALDTILDHIKDNVTAGYKVRLDGFGTFSPKALAASKGEAPFAKYSVPERQTVKFKPAAAFKEMLND